MSKNSRKYSKYTESRWWWECGYGDFSEWTCEGGPKSQESSSLREPVRYQKDAYDGMQNERSYYILIRQLGWHRRSLKLLSLQQQEQKLFLLY